MCQGIIPSVTLAATSALIVRHVDRQGGAGSGGELQNVLPQADNGNNTIRDSNISRTLLIITLSFTLFWMPLHILNTLLDFNVIGRENSTYENIYLYSGIAHLVAMISVPLNALVYGYLTPSIRREFWSCNFNTGSASAEDEAQAIEMN